MKKIINSPENMVYEMCNGFVMTNSNLEFLPEYKIIKRKETNKDKVVLISGGGSGHEPAHGGYVGKGMLDAAVCGDFFASPSQIQVYQAIKSTASNKGTLLIIKNYSGDIMNFKNAGLLAETDGLKVDYIKVDDDIAVEDSLYTVGRRGVAGTVFVHKIAGAAAEDGKSLEEVKCVAEKAAANTRSLGFALKSCTVPAKGTPTFELSENEIEFGVGIHGEPGIRKENLRSCSDLAFEMVNSIINDLEKNRPVKEVAILVNGFGATPLQELYLLNNEVVKILNDKKINVYRCFVGDYMTSLDMSGASISILNLDDDLKSLLDADADASAFKVTKNTQFPVSYVSPFPDKKNHSSKLFTFDDLSISRKIKDVITTDNIIYMVDKMGDIIIKNEVPFCELDSHAGDGDFGMSVAKGFKELKNQYYNIVSNSKNIGDFLTNCSLVIMEYCGGASGPIWGFAFKNAGAFVGEKSSLSFDDFAGMLNAALLGIQMVGEKSFGRGAVVGDKTLVDALSPCVDAWSNSNDKNFKIGFFDGAKAAVDGAKATEKIVARMGRAGTVGERSIGHPDAGAYALGVIFTELAESLEYEVL